MTAQIVATGARQRSTSNTSDQLDHLDQPNIRAGLRGPGKLYANVKTNPKPNLKDHV